MANSLEAVERISDFLADKASLEELEDWSAEYSWNILETGDPESQGIAYRLRSILNLHEDDLDEAALRADLECAIRPFVHVRAKREPKAFWPQFRISTSQVPHTSKPIGPEQNRVHPRQAMTREMARGRYLAA